MWFCTSDHATTVHTPPAALPSSHLSRCFLPCPPSECIRNQEGCSISLMPFCPTFCPAHALPLSFMSTFSYQDRGPGPSCLCGRDREVVQSQPPTSVRAINSTGSLLRGDFEGIYRGLRKIHNEGGISSPIRSFRQHLGNAHCVPGVYLEFPRTHLGQGTTGNLRMQGACHLL